MINCTTKHLGEVYRLYPSISEDIIKGIYDIASADLKLKFLNNIYNNVADKMLQMINTKSQYLIAISSLAGHVSAPLIEQFDIETGLPRKVKKVLNWPVIPFPRLN